MKISAKQVGHRYWGIISRKQWKAKLLLLSFLLFAQPEQLTASERHVVDHFDGSNLRHMLLSNDNETIFIGSNDAIFSLNASSLKFFNSNRIINGPVTILIQNKMEPDGNVFTCGNASTKCHFRDARNITSILKTVSLGNGTDLSSALVVKVEHDYCIQLSRPYPNLLPAIKKGPKYGLSFYKEDEGRSTMYYSGIHFETDVEFRCTKFVDVLQVDPFLFLFSIWDNGQGQLQTRVSLLYLKDIRFRDAMLRQRYVDMKFECGNYTVLRDIALSGSGNDTMITAVFTGENGSSSLCSFPLEQMKKRLVENIKHCFLNTAEQQALPDYIKNVCQLNWNEGTVNSTFVGDLESVINSAQGFTSVTAIVGSLQFSVEPTVNIRQEVNAVTTKLFGSSTFAFFGTQDGQIYKVQVQPRPSNLFKWSGFGSSITDVQLSADGRYLYSLTDSKLSKLVVEDCGQYLTCDNCTNPSSDPICGWSLLDNRCVWLEERNKKLIVLSCPSLDISPSFVSNVSSETNFNVKISLEVPDTNLTCGYKLPGINEQGMQPLIKLEGSKYQCSFPNITRWFTSTRAIQKFTLAIFSPFSDHPIAKASVTYINCQYINSCWSCLDEAWKGTCSWKGYLNTCFFTNVSSTVNANEILLEKFQCPVIDRFSGQGLMDLNNTLHLASHNDSVIFVHGSSFLEPRDILLYTCGLRNEILRPALFLNDSTIECLIPKTDAENRYDTVVELRWGDSLVPSTSKQVFDIYNCEKLVPENNLCACAGFKFYQPYYQCDICGNKCLGNTKSCEDHRRCPAPKIILVYPLSSHINSSVLVTILGTNLGSHFNDTRNAITIAGLTCEGVEEEFSMSSRLGCILSPSHKELNGPIKLQLYDLPAVTYEKNFSFRIPEVTKIDPSIGPKSGGTRVTIHGNHLDTGRNHTVIIGNQPCHIQPSKDTSIIVCRTMASSSLSSQNLSVNFDGSTMMAKDVNFTYIQDPVILQIFPNTSFSSGGRIVRVYGVRLHAIREPRIFSILPNLGMGNIESCIPTNNDSATYILCPTPRYNLTDRRKKRDTHSSTSARLGFQMDDVASVQNLPNIISRLVYFPDPKIFKLENERIDFQPVLVIKGYGFTLAAEKEDIDVKIGKFSNTVKPCHVTTLEPDRIVCNPPKEPPNEKESDGEYPIQVRIGNIKEYVGYIVYQQNAYLPYIIAGVIFVVIFVVLVAFVVLRRQYRLRLKTQQERMENKMDKWESAFRMKCREEFAALQTTVSDLTKDLEGGHVLFRDYVSYAIYSMLNADKEHPVLAPPTVMTDSVSQAMEQFRGLLTKSQFLLMVVRTMEKQAGFSIKDRSEVATLLMVIHHDNMEYLTSILRALLNDLVDKNIAAQTPKLVMRRSESVGEKLLTHWLSVCMYHELKESSGSALYILYKAIKIQVEKGPLDYITHCAKYSLSEDKLYIASEQDGTIKSITLEVDHIMYTDSQEHHAAIKVLDCDTITQTKNKILEIFYNNVPYSTRPSVHGTALEELEADGTTRVFNDEDASSVKDGLWKRLNTLAHYNVKDGAKVRLVISALDESLGCKLGVPNAGSPDAFIGSMRKSKRIVRTISGSNFWHLTKQTQTNKDEEVQLSSDVFLPRMLNTKGTLQTYVDDLFNEVLLVEKRVPLTIKFLFDFLDSAAARCDITDPDVLHTWKCNSLLLRFWVNVIKNPEFVFDIHKPVIIDSCLSVVAQTLMDSCSTADLVLGPHSPSNKLLYAKDIPRYKKMVAEFFSNVKSKPPVSDQDLNSFLTEKVSGKFSSCFHRTSALLEMFKYVKKFQTEIISSMDNLEAESPGSFLHLSSKLQGIIYSMDT